MGIVRVSIMYNAVKVGERTVERKHRGVVRREARER